MLIMTDTTDSTPGTPLTERAGFLISQLGFYAAGRFAERLAPLGLRPTHFGLLTHLSRNDGQTQQQLADTMGIHRNAMVGHIDDLEGRGLVQRRRHPTDRRAHALHLTDAARDLLTRAQHIANEHDAELLVALDEADRARLISLLQRVAAHAGLLPGVHPSFR
jgi:DNA-binding MarR family transcriptional regulator